jgi:hypothetical protein
MQAVHELGHCVGAWLTGGRVLAVILHPLTVSSTILSRNPHPLIVVWAGPLIGAILPVIVFLLAAKLQTPALYLFQFFAGFCMVANGLYIGLGSFIRFLDAGDMMNYGSPQWTLVIFGIVATSIGLYLWNGLGPYFGLGKAKGAVSRKATACSVLLFLITTGLLMIIG